jgi:hypothetical protein
MNLKTEKKEGFACMCVPKMVKNGFNSSFQVAKGLASPKKLWPCPKIKPIPNPQKKNKNHLNPI